MNGYVMVCRLVDISTNRRFEWKHLCTIVGPHIWDNLTDAQKAWFKELAREYNQTALCQAERNGHHPTSHAFISTVFYNDAEIDMTNDALHPGILSLLQL